MPSQLEALAAGIMGTHVEKSRRLTPTAAERASAPRPLAVPDVPGVVFTQERLAEIAVELRAQAQALLDVAAGLDVLLGVPEAVAADDAKTAAVEQKLAEREADRRADDAAKAEAGDAKAARVNALAVALVRADPMAELAEAIVEEQKVSAQALMEAVAEAQQVAIEGGVTESFPERLARLTREAQEATYAKGDDTENEDPPETPADDTVTPGAAEVSVAPGGWHCPDHGKRVTKTSKRGKPFGACPEEGCNQIERLG